MSGLKRRPKIFWKGPQIIFVMSVLALVAGSENSSTTGIEGGVLRKSGIFSSAGEAALDLMSLGDGIEMSESDHTDSQNILIIPPTRGLRANKPIEHLFGNLDRIVRSARKRNPASQIIVSTSLPVWSRQAASKGYARRIRKFAFDRDCKVLDWHDQLIRGRNPERRFTRDGFLHWSTSVETPDFIREVLGQGVTREAEGEAVIWREESAVPAVFSPAIPELTTLWTSQVARTVDTRKGVFSIQYAGPGGDLISRPFSFAAAGPGLLTLELELSRPLADHDLPTCLVHDKDGFAFQTAPVSIKRKRGRIRLVYDLSAENPVCYSVNHEAAWCETYRRRCDRLGFSLFRKSAKPITYTFHSVAFEPTPWPEKPLRIYDFRAPSFEIPAYGTFEPRFTIQGLPPGNYFDPEVVRVACEVVEPSGVTNRVNGFLYQEFTRKMVDHSEQLTAVGPLEWRIRYTPREAGMHRFKIGVGIQGAERWSATHFFECLPAEHAGFIRVSDSAPKYFETERGDFFQPVGLNMHNPFDQRNVDSFGKKWAVKGNPGTFIYERVMNRLGKAGGNAATVWMSPWWVEFEWNDSYPGCHGLTDYNLGRAWQLDQVMKYARATGLRVNLSLENHGKFSKVADSQWRENPYNVVNGGPVEAVNDFFTSLEARRIYRKKLDYLLARWGHDPTIMSFELASESDFFGENYSFGLGPEVSNWHVATARYIKENHPWPHMVSSHYSLDMGRVNKVVAAEPLLDFYGVDAYSRQVDSSYPVLLSNERNQAVPEKPYVTWEFGGSARGASKEQLKADLHFGLWSSLFLETAAAPFLWWYEFVDQEKLYPAFTSFQAFARDVDKRRPSVTMGFIAEKDQDVKGFGRVYTNPGPGVALAEAWAYSESAIHAKLNWKPVGTSKLSGDLPALPLAKPQEKAALESVEKPEGVRIHIPGAFPDQVRVEYWNSNTGKVVGRETLVSDEKGVELTLPAFIDTIAVRIHRL